jgi:hypothetical protein
MSKENYVLMQDSNGTTALIPAVSVARKEARGFTVVNPQKSPASAGGELDTSMSAQAEANPVEVTTQEDPSEDGVISNEGE